MSDDTFPRRLTRIDALVRPDHGYLTEEDHCYFIGEYTARRGFAYSASNNLLLNFKKGMDRRGRPEWRYKTKAIQEAASAFRAALADGDLDQLTFVPIPPSKAKGDPLYDDRLVQMLHSIRPTPPLDVRELVVQTESVVPAHERDERPGPRDIEALYRIDNTLLERCRQTVAVVDDMLTTGAHFRAAKSVIVRELVEATVVGLFLVRRVPDTVDLDGFEDDEA